MTPQILIVNGPNLNLLGERDPAHYGTVTLAEIEKRLTELAAELGVQPTFVQENSEGAIVGHIQRVRHSHQGIILNPGPLSHYSYAIRDTIAVIKVPVIEVHISNVVARGGYHEKLITGAGASSVICGCGPYGYELALHALRTRIDAA
ncbi:MAG TPA: type II 3-dehydroquinate dehydratase [Actinocrinis sp.]|nr:type II 3-dehydroquinate dehydratase [Actinocrinis sp.]